MNRVAAVDWSGAARQEARHLWIAEWDPSLGGVCAVVPASRPETVRYLCDLAARDDRAVVGLDFCFSFPEWWLDVCRVEDPAELWDDIDRLEKWLADCPPPFWGRPGRRRPDLTLRQHFRATELAAPLRPKSVFQIGGTGAVGTGSLRGMPALAQLRRVGFAVWPFDAVNPGPPNRPVVAEVWPRLGALSVVKRRLDSRQAWLDDHADLLGPGVASRAAASEDAFDAVAAALWLATAEPRPLVAVDTLLGFGPKRPPSAEGALSVTGRLIRREGWIAGIAVPPAE